MLKYLFIFALFSTIGWVLEIIYKSSTNKKIINPGLLTGCAITLYGFGGVFLNILCSLLSNTNSNHIALIILIVSMLLLTLLEYITGKMIIKIFHIKFWDYSNLKYNYDGIICLEFSLIWGLLAILFYYFIHPWLGSLAICIINNNIGVFLLGLYYGIFIIDLVVSINLLNKLSKYSKKTNKIINVEKLKKNLLNNSNNILDKIYPYIYINNFLKDKIEK